MIYLRRQVVPFVMIMQGGRIGSSHLMSLLAMHDNITALGEELSSLRDAGSEVQMAWMRDFLSPPLVGRHKAIGFKTKFDAVAESDAFLQALNDSDARFILMRRQNAVKQVISRLNYRRLQAEIQHHNLRKTDKVTLSPLAVDLDEFHTALQGTLRLQTRFEEFCRQLRAPILDVEYDDLLGNEKDVLMRVLSFLQVESDPRTIEKLMHANKYVKATPDNLAEAIENYADLQNQYSRTEHAWMFEQVTPALQNV